MQRILAFRSQSGIVTVERPVTGGDRFSVFVHALAHVDSMGNTVRVGDDQRRAVIGFRFDKGLDHLPRIGKSDIGDVDVAVGHRHHAEIFLGHRLAAGSELRNCAGRCRLGGLTTGVGVNLGIKNQQVDVLAGSDDMVEAAVTDIIGPTVAADTPDGLVDQVIRQREKLHGRPFCTPFEGFFQGCHPLTLLLDAGLVGLISGKDLFHQRDSRFAGFAVAVDQFTHQLAG